MNPRRRKDETESGLWRSGPFGEHGFTVRAREKRRGGPVVLDSQANRAEATGIRVRDRNGRIIPGAITRAEQLAKDRAAELQLSRARAELPDPARMTLAQAYEKYFAGGLPDSKPAKVHHKAARTFWLAELSEDTPWNRITPADVEQAALELGKQGRVQTADKRVKCLRTVWRWLMDRKDIEGLKNPTRGFDFDRLWQGYTPRQPRYSAAELRKLFTVRYEVDPRFALMLALADDSGARSVALYTARRSMVDESMDVPPSPEQAPFGWALLAALKGQARMLTYLTLRQRIEIVRATWMRWNGVRWVPGFLSVLEGQWNALGADYPLVPGGHLSRDGMAATSKPVSGNTALRWLREAEEAAGVPRIARRKWHGIRRAWSDYTHASTDLDVVTAAGGWSRRETVEEIYLSRVRLGHLERSRAAQEQKGNWA
ncbi:MAG: hypothetical protein ACRENP_12205 [Longimicrobiales bacterium]